MGVIWSAIGVVFLLSGFLFGGHWSTSVDALTLIIMIGCAMAFTAAAHGRDLWRAIGLGFFGQQGDEDATSHCVEVLRTLSAMFVTTGWVCAIIGAISISKYMDSFEHFGPALAVLLLAPFYGLVFGRLIVGAAIRRLETQG